MTEMAVGALDVRVGEPGVEREDRHLDREADEQAYKRQHARRASNRCENARGDVRGIHHRDHVECMRAGLRINRAEVQPDHDQQQQHRACKRVEEKLDGGVFATRTAPDADKEIHRQQHHFPEHVEEEHVERNKHAHHARVEQQEHRKVALQGLRDTEGRERGEETDQRSEQHHRHRKSVDTQKILDADLAEPRGLGMTIHGSRSTNCIVATSLMPVWHCRTPSRSVWRGVPEGRSRSRS
jgi:hypothetical protein